MDVGSKINWEFYKHTYCLHMPAMPRGKILIPFLILHMI